MTGRIDELFKYLELLVGLKQAGHKVNDEIGTVLSAIQVELQLQKVEK